MPAYEAPCVELGSVPQTPSIVESPSLSEVSSASSPEPQHVRATPLFRALAMPPPDPVQPPGQDELERRLPGYRRIVIPRELTLIELLKQCSGVTTDDEVLRIREAKLRVVAERVGLRRLHVLAPHLRALTLDGSALSSLRDLGIGLVHLKVLSVNRCGLTCLDGVWGLGALCEFYAAGNRLQDLQPLAALQKLHTLNLADNPIGDTNRVWTLGVCGSLRRLTLTGTPAADALNYRSRVASSLPMLVYLDDHPLHVDIEYDTDDLLRSYGSDSDGGDAEVAQLMQPVEAARVEPEPNPSKQFPETSTSSEVVEGDADGVAISFGPIRRARRPATTEGAGSRPARRPATTEGAGSRPARPDVPPRPRTAHARPAAAPSRLQILNTLMDEEWRSSGSELTSHGAVCGNLARALRRPTSVRKSSEVETEKEMVEQAMEEAARSLAEEIPRAPRLEDWARFRQETGIDINIDFNERPRDADPSEVMERLERIEKETSDRIKHEKADQESGSSSATHTYTGQLTMLGDYDSWRGLPLEHLPDPTDDVDALFNDMFRISPIHRDRFRGNTQRRPE